MREVARVDRSQQEVTDLMNALYVKLGEAVELAEQVQQVSQSKQELRQARKIAQQITRLRGRRYRTAARLGKPRNLILALLWAVQ